MKYCAKCETYYEMDQEVFYCDKCEACIHPDKSLTSVEVRALSLKARVLLTVLCDTCRMSSTTSVNAEQHQALLDMENIGYQNDNSEKLAESSCNSSTVELHHVSKKSKPGHPCNAEACRRANAKTVPSPWHRLKSVFLVVLIVLFALWICLMAVLITRNAL